MKTHFIAGEWRAGEGQKFTSLNPATQEEVWQGRQATSTEIDCAINSARQSFFSWSLQSFSQRLLILQRYAELLAKDKERFANLISQETGKPHWEALTEVSAMVNKVSIAEQAFHQRSGLHESEQNGVTQVLEHRPHGVIAVLGPFNMPGHLPNGHMVPALLAGNTIVFKPSEYTPAVAAAMLDYLQQAGLPPGVVNLIQGQAETGRYLSTHSEIDGVFFTGSYATGLILSQHFSKHPEKILALEMGGNNPLIVTEVKDVSAAVYQTIQSAFITAGQRCTCARRLIVPVGAKGDHFINELSKKLTQLIIGPPTAHPQPFMGPVISEQAVAKLLQAQQQLIADGANALLTLEQQSEKSWIVTPGLLDVTDVKQRADVEFFGPLLQVIRVNNFDEALREANATAYGLSAGLLSDNPELFTTFWQQIRAGVVNWNRPTTGASSQAPFGGIGHSGNHRPSAYYAADYCAYPVASMRSPEVTLPEELTPGVSF
jgi:succinylglutamic semialdehyde dehydrogenase